MIIYVILSFIVLFVIPNINVRVIGINGDKHSSSKNILLLFTFVIMFIMLCGLRDSGGADDEAYRLYYEKNYGGSMFSFYSTDKEPLFNLLRTFGYSIGLNYKILFLGYAGVTSIFIALALKNIYENKREIEIYLAAFLFISYSSMFTTMRQAAAMAVLIYLHSIKKPTLRRQIVMYLLMVCCHYGSVLILPFDIVFGAKKYKISSRVKITILSVCFICGQVINLSSIIRKVTSILGLYSYMNTAQDYESEIGFVTLILFALFILKIFYERRSKHILSETELIYNDRSSYGQLMYFSFIFLTSNIRWGNRLSYYFLPFIPMLIVDIFRVIPIKTQSKRYMQLVLMSLLFGGFIFVMYKILGPDGYQWSLDFIS